MDFNPRSPHGERHRRPLRLGKRKNFNPRSPHGERRGIHIMRPPRPYFNPRSPHGERPLFRRWYSSSLPFQSTLPARGATRAVDPIGRSLTISIHAPRTGSDAPGSGHHQGGQFQSTLPARGATPQRKALLACAAPFQSTLPARGATTRNTCRLNADIISIHAPRTGSDDRTEINHIGLTCISIHAPRTGSDTSSACPSGTSKRFQSTLPARGATIPLGFHPRLD